MKRSVISIPRGQTIASRETHRRRSSSSRHACMAIRYSQVRAEALLSARSRARHAQSTVSCTSSSASRGQPSIRLQNSSSPGRWRSTSRPNASSSPARAAASRPRSSVLSIRVSVIGLRKVRRRAASDRSEEHTSELQSRQYLVCRLLLEKKKHIYIIYIHKLKKNKKNT